MCYGIPRSVLSFVTMSSSLRDFVSGKIQLDIFVSKAPS